MMKSTRPFCDQHRELRTRSALSHLVCTIGYCDHRRRMTVLNGRSFHLRHPLSCRLLSCHVAGLSGGPEELFDDLLLQALDKGNDFVPFGCRHLEVVIAEICPGRCVRRFRWRNCRCRPAAADTAVLRYRFRPERRFMFSGNTFGRCRKSRVRSPRSP